MTRDQDEKPKEPQGFTESTSGPSSEAAHEEGWGLNEEERKKPPKGAPPDYGGTDYDYGAQDFGDTPSRVSEEEDQDQKKKAG